MVSFFINRVRGWRVLALTAVSLAYGALIILVLPFWGRMEALEGGVELQARFTYNAATARSALYALKAEALPDALIFYALDVPNALLYAASLAALIAFGVRRLRLAQTIAAWLVLVPFVSALADIAENSCLAYALLNKPAQLRRLTAIAGHITMVKFIAGYSAQALAILLSLAGLAWWFIRRLRDRYGGGGGRRRQTRG